MSIPISRSQTVLISGVNGYIASTTAKAFLDAGYSVRGTARSSTSSVDILQTLDSYVKTGRFEVVEVPDIVVAGAFDDAVKGCHAIAHIASPISLSFTDPEPVIRTAVSGTVSILESAMKHGGSNLKSVVLISSIGAIIEPKTPPYTYTEADWNNLSEAEVARLGKQTPSGHIYRASKSVSEKAFWKFREEHHPRFTMTATNPAYVCGPPVVLPQDPDKLNETVSGVWKILSGQPIPPSLGGSGAFVDVRDVAELMVFAVEHCAEADGQRYIACGGTGSMQAIADILHEHYPARRAIMDSREPGQGYTPGHGFPPGGISIDAIKAVKARGKEWIGYEKSILDAAKEFEIYL